MNKYEAEFETRKLAVNAKNYEYVANFLTHALTMGTIAFTIYTIINGLKAIVVAQPEAINALSSVVDKLQINAIIGYLTTGVCGIGWAYERKGKKRAINQTSNLRREVEQHDAYHPSSGLDINGHTPK